MRGKLSVRSVKLSTRWYNRAKRENIDDSHATVTIVPLESQTPYFCKFSVNTNELHNAISRDDIDEKPPMPQTVRCDLIADKDIKGAKLYFEFACVEETISRPDVLGAIIARNYENFKPVLDRVVRLHNERNPIGMEPVPQTF